MALMYKRRRLRRKRSLFGAATVSHAQSTMWVGQEDFEDDRVSDDRSRSLANELLGAK